MAWNDKVRTMAALSLLTACGVKSVGDLEGGADESGSSSGGDSHSSSHGTESDSDSVTSESGGECPPEGGSMCDPQPMLAPEATAWSIDANQGFEATLVDIACTVAAFDDDDTTITIELQCDEEELAAHTVVVPHNPITPFNLGVDSSVRLAYHAQTPFWTNYWFTLRSPDGRLIIGAGAGSELLPVDDLFAPLELSVRDDVCPQECLVDECGPTVRHAVEVTLDGETTTIYDANEAVVGSTTQLTVMIGEATGFIDLGVCFDIPPTWYRTIVYDSSEG